MGEAKQKKSATQKFIAQYPDCYFCGGRNHSATREHMPPKALFDNSHRPGDFVMPACDMCNRETSTADLVAAVVSRWRIDFDLQSFLDHQKLSSQIRVQAPELLKEWLSVDKYDQEKVRKHLLDSGVSIPTNARFAVIGPLTVRQLNLFAHKVVIGLYFNQFRVPLSPIGAVWAVWRSKEDFALYGVPADLLGMFSHYRTLTQGRWSAHQTFECRYNYDEAEGLFGCIARFRDGLFVAGFAVANREDVVSAQSEWICPMVPSVLLDNPRFQTKN